MLNITVKMLLMAHYFFLDKVVIFDRELNVVIKQGRSMAFSKGMKLACWFFFACIMQVDVIAQTTTGLSFSAAMVCGHDGHMSRRNTAFLDPSNRFNSETRYSHLGNIEALGKTKSEFTRITNTVEKPTLEEALAKLAINKRYVASSAFW
jgi:hypothetical protein